MSVFIGIYVAGLIATWVGTAIYYGVNTRSRVTEQRNVARLLVLSPVWFVALPLYVLKVFPWLWKKADWQNVRHDYEHEDNRREWDSRL